MIVRANNLPQKSNRVDAVICWMSEEPLKVRGDYWVQHTTRLVKGFVSELNYKIDVDTMHRDAAETLTLNEIGRIQLTTTQPLYYDFPPRPGDTVLPHSGPDVRLRNTPRAF
jgi:bifunctional enzyme CysN/CysC